MKVMCIKEMKSTDTVFSSIKIDDWIDVYEKSIYDSSALHNINPDKYWSSCYFFLSNNFNTEYAFDKDNFITLEEFREQQLEKLGL